jgi:cyanophycinase
MIEIQLVPRKGYLIPIGGAEDKIDERIILSRFVQLAGRNDARLAIIPAASQMPVELGHRYSEIFTDMGAVSVRVIHINERAQANDPGTAAQLEGVTGIFLTGGEQLRLVTYLGGTRLAREIASCHAKGATVAGTSAGASALSRHMIAFGRSGASPSQRMVQLSPGLGLIEGVIIDQHFRQRDRMGRLITAVALNPAEIGIGIDEDTALLIGSEGDCEIAGAGSVTVVDGSRLEYTDIHAVKQYGPVAALGITVHILTQGCRFNLHTRIAEHPHSEQASKFLIPDPNSD